MSRVVRGSFPEEAFKGTNVELRPDFKDFLRLLNKHQVIYLIVGGYAVMKYTEPFYTKDIDIWIDATPDNATRTYQALLEFGTPMADLSVHDLTQQHIVFQFGMAPARVDLMTSIDAVTFSEAWKHRVQTNLDVIPISIISLEHLKQNKMHLARLEKYGNQPH